MKKCYLFIILFLALGIAFSACDSGSSTSGGDAGSGSVIDISNTVDCTIPYSAYTFGSTTGDQIKRYQTFIADTHTKLNAVEVKIRKNSDTQTYKNITVELYKTVAGLPSGDNIAETTINAASLGTNFTVKRAQLQYQTLIPGTEYAVVLGQVDLADGNDGFEWCTAEVNDELSFGKLAVSGWSDESGNGDGWLKVYVSGGISSSVTSYYTGTISVVVDDTIGTTCFDTFANNATFDIVLENDPSFSSSMGMLWKNSTGVTITGSYLKTSTCLYTAEFISSGGEQTLIKSASEFPVTLWLYNGDYFEETDKNYQLMVSNIGFPGCSMKIGPVTSTITGIILTGLVKVNPIPADTTHINNVATVYGPSDEEVTITYDLTLHTN